MQLKSLLQIPKELILVLKQYVVFFIVVIAWFHLVNFTFFIDKDLTEIRWFPSLHYFLFVELDEAILFILHVRKLKDYIGQLLTWVFIIVIFVLIFDEKLLEKEESCGIVYIDQSILVS